MRDWKNELSKKVGGKSGASEMKKCACGAPITKPGATQCYSCFKKSQGFGSRTGGGNNSGEADLPDHYLQGGYFEEKNGKNYMKEEIFISWARDVSSALKKAGLKSAAIRRFFSKLRATEHKYKTTNDFDLAREGIYAFVRDVSYSENRGVTPVLFSRFIEANVQLAKKDAEHFRAFIEHFQSVVAFFREK
jgi:CRISPR-associated protein Csm2